MKNVMTPSITMAIVFLAAMAAVALRAAARRPEPRWAPGGESAPIAVRTPGSPAGRPVPLSRCRTYFTSCTPMGAMLLARSATASTGRRNASSEPQPEPLILGLVPDQPAPGAVTDRVHNAIYCRRQAAELSEPGCLMGPGSPGQPTRAGRCRRRCRQRRVNPRLRQTCPGARRQSGRRATWLHRVLRGGIRRDADALGQRTHMCAEMSISPTRISMHEPAYLHALLTLPAVVVPFCPSFW